jgi:hypothetical protein
VPIEEQLRIEVHPETVLQFVESGLEAGLAQNCVQTGPDTPLSLFNREVTQVEARKPEVKCLRGPVSIP